MNMDVNNEKQIPEENNTSMLQNEITSQEGNPSQNQVVDAIPQVQPEEDVMPQDHQQDVDVMSQGMLSESIMPQEQQAIQFQNTMSPTAAFAAQRQQQANLMQTPQQNQPTNMMYQNQPSIMMQQNFQRNIPQGNMKYCSTCGAMIPAAAVICTSCGCQTGQMKMDLPNIVIQNNNTNTNVVGHSGKPINKWTALLLCFLLGWCGIHRFYEGKVASGILYLFTLGLFGIGWVIDFIIILFSPNPYYV